MFSTVYNDNDNCLRTADFNHIKPTVAVGTTYIGWFSKCNQLTRVELKEHKYSGVGHLFQFLSV